MIQLRTPPENRHKQKIRFLEFKSLMKFIFFLSIKIRGIIIGRYKINNRIDDLIKMLALIDKVDKSKNSLMLISRSLVFKFNPNK